MANEEQWIKLLEAVRGPLPEAYIAMGELVSTNKNVRWNPIEIPKGKPYVRVPVFSNELGDISVIYFGGPVVTMPHRWPGARVFYALLDGDLNQRSWCRVQGEAKAVGERRVTAPDLLFVPRDQTFSFSSPDGAVCIVVHSEPRSELEIDDPKQGRTVTLQPGGEVTWPVDPESVVSDEPWTAPS